NLRADEVAVEPSGDGHRLVVAVPEGPRLDLDSERGVLDDLLIALCRKDRVAGGLGRGRARNGVLVRTRGGRPALRQPAGNGGRGAGGGGPAGRKETAHGQHRQRG